MDDIRLLIRKISPASIALQTIRAALTMHPAAARGIVNEFCQPLKEQRRFIRKFDNEHWKGSLIMSEMIQCDDDTALERLRKSDIVIFEIHGGGFRVGNSTMYMDSFISWLRLFKSKYNLDACIMSIEYGLAPMHKYPEPLYECIAAYKYLTQNLGISPSNVIFSGDSAGAALAIESLLRTYSPEILNDMDAPRTNFDLSLPAGILLSSPLISPETTHASWKKFEKLDMVSPKLAEIVFKEYLGLPETKIEDLPILRISQISNGFDRFLPKHILMFIGGREVLRDGAVELFEAVRKEGRIEITLVEEDLPHDWFLIHQIIDKKKSCVIQKYDEMFVDFAVKAVQKANAHSEPTSSTHEAIEHALMDNEDPNAVQEKIVPDRQKMDQPFDFSKFSVYKPNINLTEYSDVTDGSNKSVS